jgi:hypothetical protein
MNLKKGPFFRVFLPVALMGSVRLSSVWEGEFPCSWHRAERQHLEILRDELSCREEQAKLGK